MSDTVTVKAVKFHTHHGAAHEAGEVYAVAATEVDNLVAQGMAAYHDDPPPADDDAAEPDDDAPHRRRPAGKKK